MNEATAKPSSATKVSCLVVYNYFAIRVCSNSIKSSIKNVLVARRPTIPVCLRDHPEKFCSLPHCDVISGCSYYTMQKKSSAQGFLENQFFWIQKTFLWVWLAGSGKFLPCFKRSKCQILAVARTTL